jgi:hypothetical protein
MNRRGFLATLAALPFVGKLVPKPALRYGTPVSEQAFADIREMLAKAKPAGRIALCPQCLACGGPTSQVGPMRRVMVATGRNHRSAVLQADYRCLMPRCRAWMSHETDEEVAKMLRGHFPKGSRAGLQGG